MTNIVIITDVLIILSINITNNIITDVWAWEKYYKQAEVLQRIDVELLPTEATVIVHHHTVGNRRVIEIHLFLISQCLSLEIVRP